MNLTQDKLKDLKSLHKKERDGRVRDRIKAVLLINAGYTYEQVAEILLIDDETVRRHVQEFLSSEKLTNNNKGSDSKLSECQTSELVKYLQTNTYMDVRPIINYIRDKYNIKYSKSGMTTWLNAHKFKYKKPHPIPAKFTFRNFNVSVC